MALPSTPPMIRPIIFRLLFVPRRRRPAPSPGFPTMVACGRPGGGASRRRTVLSFLSIRGGRFGFRPEHVSRVDEAVEGRGVDETEGERRLAQRRALGVRLLRDLQIGRASGRERGCPYV